MNYSKYPPEMYEILDHLSVRGLALWGMALLDPCCAALSEGRHQRPLVQSDAVERLKKGTHQTTNEIELRFSKSIDKVLLEVPLILKNILDRREFEATRQMLVDLLPHIQGLDFLVVPLNEMSQGIHAYMCQMDVIWDQVIDSSQDSSKSLSPGLVRSFCVAMSYLAGGLGVPMAQLVTESRTITQSFIMPEVRASFDPIGPEIPAEVIASVLAPLQFFKA